MDTGKQLELGFRTYFNAIGFIFSKGLWWAFIVPVILNVLLFIGGYELISSVTHHMQDWFVNLVGLKDSEFFLSGVLTGFLSGVIWVLLKVLFFFLFAYWGGYITLALLSPLFAYLSQKTDEIITGKKYPFDGDQWMRDMWRGILIVLRNLFIQTGWMILIFLIGLIPVVGWFGALVLFIISAYFYGFAFIDYTSERSRSEEHTSELQS